MKKLTMFAVLLAFLLAAAACEDTSLPPKENDLPQKEELTQEQCKAAGGNWNECGSPCAGTDAEMCIQVCSPQCECGGIAGFSCPESYKCRLTGKIADEMGVCVKG